ncbi:MAG: L-threonylcarbamoyladenylate synthase, partial [Pseudobdellovibrionaceae bacterium]
MGLPTETVYGLAARIDRKKAIEKIFSTKKRPFFDPLIVHVHSISQARSLFASWNELMTHLANAFWPGPLTIVSKKQELVDVLITSGLETVGVRLPNNAVALELLRKVTVPLAAPSANLFGQLSPTSAKNVRDIFNEEVFVLDGGPCEIGIESTIIFVQGKQISLLRPGMISMEQIENSILAASLPFELIELKKQLAPGQMNHHYMPSVPLVLYTNPDMTELEISNKVMTEIKKMPDEVEHVRIQKPAKIQKIAFLTLDSDSSLAARQLYASLRQAADQG